jgi:hypothetical protein
VKRLLLGFVLLAWTAALFYTAVPALAACWDCDNPKGPWKCEKVPSGYIECTPQTFGCVLKGKCDGKPKAAPTRESGKTRSEPAAQSRVDSRPTTNTESANP